MHRLAFAATVVALALAVTSSAQASDYPPDYPVCTSTLSAETGPFTLINVVHNPYTLGAQLTVSYHGYLLEKYPAEDIEIYLRLNGKDLTMPAQGGAFGDAYVFLQVGARNCFRDYETSLWMCDFATDDEKSLFENAQTYGAINDWNIEVAASAHGQWDSNFGANFRTMLRNKHGC